MTFIEVQKDTKNSCGTTSFNHVLLYYPSPLLVIPPTSGPPEDSFLINHAPPFTCQTMYEPGVLFVANSEKADSINDCKNLCIHDNSCKVGYSIYRLIPEPVFCQTKQLLTKSFLLSFLFYSFQFFTWSEMTNGCGVRRFSPSNMIKATGLRTGTKTMIVETPDTIFVDCPGLRTTSLASNLAR